MTNDKEDTTDSSNDRELTVEIATSPDDVDIHVGALYWTNTPHDSPAPGPYQFLMPANYDDEADEYEMLTDLPKGTPGRQFQMEGRHLRNNIARGWFDLVARPMAVGALIALAKQEGVLFDKGEDSS